MAATKSILIIGGSGFVGFNLAAKLRESYKVFATYHNHHVPMRGVTALPFSLKNRVWMKRLVNVAQPDVVIYAAGNNSVEWSERNPRDAEAMHTAAPATLATMAEYYQPRFILISNCYTFDGSRGNYHETDTVLPSMILGKAALGGENFLKGRAMNYNILRCSPILGRSNAWNPSWLDQLRMALDRGQRVQIPNQETHSFASMAMLEESVVRLIESGIRNRILHLGGLTKLTHLDLAHKIARRFGYDTSAISPAAPSPTAQAEGPLDFSLNSSELLKLTGQAGQSIDEHLELIARRPAAAIDHIPWVESTRSNP